MRKAVKKDHVVKKRKPAKKTLPFVSFRTLIIGISVLLLVIGLNNFRGNVHVLGVNTGPAVLLAQDGQESGDSQKTEDNNQQKPEGQNTASSGINKPIVQGAVTQETQVDCVNENGIHFTTSFHDCQEINQKRGNAGFRFTPLENPGEQVKPEIEQPEVASGPAHRQLEMQTEGNKGEINMETPGLHVEVKREDDGSVHITAKRADGTEINLQTNALDQLNEALKDKEVEVATSSSSANNLVLRRRGVEAATELPISVDPNTHELTVTTPAGIKTVTVLPDQAVNNLLSNRVLTSVETQVSSASGAVSQVSILTQLNNQPVFAVNGITQKNLLGLFPIGFAKTAFVSATNGSVVQVNEALFNRILEALSF